MGPGLVLSEGLQADLVATIKTNGPHGRGPKSFVFPSGSDCVHCPNTATGLSAIVGPFNTVDSNEERCLSSKNE